MHLHAYYYARPGIPRLVQWAGVRPGPKVSESRTVSADVSLGWRMAYTDQRGHFARLIFEEIVVRDEQVVATKLRPELAGFFSDRRLRAGTRPELSKRHSENFSDPLDIMADFRS